MSKQKNNESKKLVVKLDVIMEVHKLVKVDVFLRRSEDGSLELIAGTEEEERVLFSIDTGGYCNAYTVDQYLRDILKLED